MPLPLPPRPAASHSVAMTSIWDIISNPQNHHWTPPKKQRFDMVFSQGSFGSSNHQWLEIPWFWVDIIHLPWGFASQHTVDGTNPIPNHRLDVFKTPINNEINYQPQLVSRISEPSTVFSAPFFCPNKITPLASCPRRSTQSKRS